MEFTFVLPRNNKELLEDTDCTNYYVKQVFSANEIPAQLRTALQALQTSDAFYMFDHFDTFFSVIENVSQLQIGTLVRAIDILYSTTENLGQMLDVYLKQETLDRQSDYVYAASGRKNKKNNDDQLPQYANYEIKRHEVLVQLCNIMNLPIEKLWNMSMIDEDFVNLLCDLAYRSLSHPSTKEKRVTDAIFQILGTAIKQYRHGIAFPVQIVEIMDREESAVVPIARGVRYLNDEFGITSVLSNLLKELIDKVNTNPGAQTTSKNLALFITEIGEISPELALQYLDMSQELLNLEPYAVRNSLFSVMNIVIVNHLSGEGMNEEKQALRDECLEDLWNHMNDVSSYVRSRVLAIWNDLKNRDAVPLAWILRILGRAVERLEDKTATVRRNAIALLRSFLESNPFSAKLQMDDVEEERSRVIREKMTEQEKTEEDVNEDFRTRCVPALTPILTEILMEQQENIDSVTTNGMDEETSEERVKKVRDLLKKGDFDTVARYIVKLDSCNLETRKTMEVSQQVIYFNVLLNSYMFDDYSTELALLDGVIGFLQDALEFSKTIAEAVPKLEILLMSRTPSDVLEAIEFFKTGYLFHIKGTEKGMRLMLRLLYINTGLEKNEKGEAVIKAYHSILFGTDAVGRAHHLKVVDNLYHFLQNITTGEYTAFELMIKTWVQSDDININIINVLFERFLMKLPDTTSSYARCCMELLILVSNAKPAVAHDNKKLITDIIKSQRILDDPRIFAGCLQLLINSIQPSNDKDRINKLGAFYKRYDDKEVIDCITNSFKRFFFYPKMPNFELIATKSIDFLYKMCYAPDLLGQDIVYDICTKLNEISQKRADKMMDVSENGVESSQVTEMYIPKCLLPRIIFIFGYIASKELVYLDNDVYLNVKHREDLKREKKEAKNNASKVRKSTVNLNASASETLKRLSTVNTADADAPEQDEAYMGATAEDTLAEMISNICEKELIGSADGLLYHFVPILTEILSHPAKYDDQDVQRAAVLTLMRFMVVSASLCSDRIAFLMNILKKTKDATMKCNIIIGLADLTSRFANTIEPWIPNFYTMLLETNETVRLTTMKMLSYVILQAIVRVTGQIADMATCIVDDNLEIRSAAREFFRQLVESKELEYYKIMPDIVSRLSPSQSPIAEDKFQTIMRYLLELIQKDRVEKLCGRFRNTNTDIAFCLSLLNHTEKTMKKLLDHLPNYKDKVQYDEIHDCFKTIISNANKQITKVELKNLAKELDQKITACLQVNENGDVSVNAVGIQNADDGDENAAAPSSSQPPKKNTKKKPTKTAKQKRTNRFARAMSSDDDDDDFEENSPPPKGKAKARGKSTADFNESTASARSVRGRRGKVVSSSDESEEDSPPPPVKGRRGRK